MMNCSEYLDFIKQRFNNDWTVKDNFTLNYETFNLYAYGSFTLGRTFITAKDIIDKFYTNEHVFIKYINNLDMLFLNEFIDNIISIHNNLITPDKNHKSSYFTYVILYNNCSDLSAMRIIKKFKYEKVYKFYFYGFSQIRLLAINLNTQSIINNRCGRNIKKMYLPAS